MFDLDKTITGIYSVWDAWGYACGWTIVFTLVCFPISIILNLILGRFSLKRFISFWFFVPVVACLGDYGIAVLIPKEQCGNGGCDGDLVFHFLGALLIFPLALMTAFWITQDPSTCQTKSS